MSIDITEEVRAFYRRLCSELESFPDGARFFSVRGLMEHYSVSRRVVDETLIRLRKEGRIQTESRNGIFVRKEGACRLKRILEVRVDWPSAPSDAQSAALSLELGCRGYLFSRFAFSPSSGLSFLEKLEQSVEKDLERSMTLTGPHVDDFEMFCSGKPLRYFGSRGQCRMISLALKLAEFELVSELADQVVVLVDDAVADLDRKARSAFFEKVRSAGQIFYAFTDLPEEKMFSDSAIIRL